MNEEKMMILKMLQEGKITAEEAAKLLESIEPGREKVEEDKVGGEKGKFFRVKITDTDSGKSRANIRIPLSVLGAATKFGANFVPDIEGLDNQELSSAIRRGEVGKIIDVYDDEDGEHVEVFIE